MTVPFQHKQPYREIFDFAGSVNKMSEPEMHQLNAYLPTAFSQACFDKFVPMCPLNVDNFMGFIAMGQQETGEKFDEISWGYVKNYAKHNLFQGEDSAALKDVRKSVDFTLKASYKPPELDDLWKSCATSSEETVTAEELVTLLKKAVKKPIPLMELLRACQSRGKNKKPPPKVTPPPAGGGGGKAADGDDGKKEPSTPATPASPPPPKKAPPPPPEPKKAPEPASPKTVPPPPVPKPKPAEPAPKKEETPPPPPAPAELEKKEEPTSKEEKVEPAAAETAAPSSPTTERKDDAVSGEKPAADPKEDTMRPTSSPVNNNSQTVAPPVPTMLGVPRPGGGTAGIVRKGQGVVSFDDLDSRSESSVASGGGLRGGPGSVASGSDAAALNAISKIGSFSGPSAQLAQFLNRSSNTSEMGVSANLGGGGGSRLPPEVIAMAAELDAKRDALKKELDKELDLLGSNNDAIQVLTSRLEALKTRNAVAPEDETRFVVNELLSKQGGEGSIANGTNSNNFLDSGKLEEKMQKWIASSQRQQQLMRTEISRLRQKEQYDASQRALSPTLPVTSTAPQQHGSANNSSTYSPTIYGQMSQSPVYFNQQLSQQQQQQSALPVSVAPMAPLHHPSSHVDPSSNDAGHHHIHQPENQPPLGIQHHPQQYPADASSPTPQAPPPPPPPPGPPELPQDLLQDLNLSSALRVTQFNEELRQKSEALRQKEKSLQRIRHLEEEEAKLQREIEQRSQERDRNVRGEKEKKAQRQMIDEIQRSRQYAVQRGSRPASSAGGSDAPSPYHGSPSSSLPAAASSSSRPLQHPSQPATANYLLKGHYGTGKLPQEDPSDREFDNKSGSGSRRLNSGDAARFFSGNHRRF